jgi:hypothetical protein
MGGDWDGRGGNPVKPLGQRFYSQTTAPLRIGSVDADAPRTYEGYELKEKFPTFIYRVGDAEVRERITPLPEGQGVGIVRTFEVEPHGKTVYYVASDDTTVTLTASTGKFEPADVAASFKSPEKKPGKVLELPGGEKVTFSVTIKANGVR